MDDAKFYQGDVKGFNPLDELSPARRDQLKGGPSKKSTAGVKTGDITLNMPAAAVDSTKSLSAYKTASENGGGGSVRTIPRVYSPLFELSNLQLPRDRRTLNAWCRHFYSTHPLVRNCVNLHATFPISKFEITCDEKTIETEMNELHDQYKNVELPFMFQPKRLLQAKCCYMDSIKPWANSDGYIYPCNSISLLSDAQRYFHPKYRLCHWTEIQDYFRCRGNKSLNVATCDRCAFTKNNGILEDLLTPVEHEDFL